MMCKVIKAYNMNNLVLRCGKNEIFQSYDSIIAFKDGKTVYLDKYMWDYSITTVKYLCKYLGVKAKKEILDGIKEGKYKMKELNKEV